MRLFLTLWKRVLYSADSAGIGSFTQLKRKGDNVNTFRFTTVLSIVLAAVMVAGCGIAQTKPCEPSPISVSGVLPKLGHYIGKNPNISFDVTTSGIENLTIDIPSSKDFMCTIEPLCGVITMNSDGTFSYSFQPMFGIGSPNTISGKINGGTANGFYSIDICQQKGNLTSFYIPFKGKWSASLNSH